jgi:hypothetical protein
VSGFARAMRIPLQEGKRAGPKHKPVAGRTNRPENGRTHEQVIVNAAMRTVHPAGGRRPEYRIAPDESHGLRVAHRDRGLLRGLHPMRSRNDCPQSNSTWEIAMKREPDYADYRSHVEKALQRRSEDLGEIASGVFSELWKKAKSVCGLLAPASGTSKRQSIS